MTAIGEFTTPAGAFPLGRVFEDHPAASLELDRVVPGGDAVVPHFLVTDPDALDALFAPPGRDYRNEAPDHLLLPRLRRHGSQ